jgi:hypothetical protein
MADLSITATSVVTISGTVSKKVAGETITAGAAVYVKSSDGKLWNMQADGTTEEAGVGVDFGIALNGASVNQPVLFQLDGSLTLGGATTAKTTSYMVSAAAGKICPQADLVSTNKITYLGYATDAVGTFVFNKKATGAVV